jgi:hypothetical protein
VVSKAGNICVVKSTYQVRLGNSATPLLPASTGSAPSTQIASKKNVHTISLPAVSTSAILQGTSIKPAQTLSQPASVTSQLVAQQNAASASTPAAPQNTELTMQQLSPVDAVAPKLLTVAPSSQQPKANSQSAPTGMVTNLGAKANPPSKTPTTSAGILYKVIFLLMRKILFLIIFLK